MSEHVLNDVATFGDDLASLLQLKQLADLDTVGGCTHALTRPNVLTSKREIVAAVS